MYEESGTILWRIGKLENGDCKTFTAGFGIDVGDGTHGMLLKASTISLGDGCDGYNI
jgi:hypothetical protein